MPQQMQATAGSDAAVRGAFGCAAVCAPPRLAAALPPRSHHQSVAQVLGSRQEAAVVGNLPGMERHDAANEPLSLCGSSRRGVRVTEV